MKDKPKERGHICFTPRWTKEGKYKWKKHLYDSDGYCYRCGWKKGERR